jgi:hypothetical protein
MVEQKGNFSLRDVCSVFLRAPRIAPGAIPYAITINEQSVRVMINVEVGIFCVKIDEFIITHQPSGGVFVKSASMIGFSLAAVTEDAPGDAGWASRFYHF